MKDLIISDDNMFYDMLYRFVYDGINVEKKFKFIIDKTTNIQRMSCLGTGMSDRINKYVYPFVCSLVRMCLDRDSFIKYMRKLSKFDYKKYENDGDRWINSFCAVKEILGEKRIVWGAPFGIGDFYRSNEGENLHDDNFIKHSLIKGAAVYYFIHARNHTVEEGIFCEKESKFLDIMDNYKNLIMESYSLSDIINRIDGISNIYSFPEYFYEKIYVAVLYLYKEIYKRELLPFKVISSMRGSSKFIHDSYSKSEFRNNLIRQSLDLIPYVEKSLMSAETCK